jgi:hypothetical protein
MQIMRRRLSVWVRKSVQAGVLSSSLLVSVWGVTLGTRSAAFAVGDANRSSCPSATESSGGFSATLPDCRAYELVTPSGMNGAPLGSEQVSADGTAFGFSSIGLFGDPGNGESSNGAQYVATRGATGWSTVPLEPSATQFLDATPFSGENHALSADFTESLLTLVPSGASPVDFRYYRLRPSGALAEVGPTVPPGQIESWKPGERGAPTTLLGAAVDLSHVIFSPDTQEAGGGTAGDFQWLWPGDPTRGQFSLYDYSGSGNTEPLLVDVKPGPGEGDARPVDHPAVTSQCGADLGAASETGTLVRQPQGKSVDSYNAISSSPSAAIARTIFFTAFRPTPKCEAQNIVTPVVNELYARIADTKTVAISQPSKEDCSACDTSESAKKAAPEGAVFQGASQDGSKVFFLAEQKLFEGTRGEAGLNLYEYDFTASDPHAKVSLVAPQMATGGGVMRVAEDGSVVYLVSEDVPVGAHANEFGKLPEAHAANLYAYDTRTHTFTFVAVLSSADRREWQLLDERAAQASPDGRFLLFASFNDITPDASGGAHQLYRYDARPTKAEEEAGTPRLVRVTVGDAASHNGNNGAFDFVRAYAYASPAFPTPSPPFMTNDGARVFFMSSAALVPGALNNACAYEEAGECITQAVNIYEYEDGHVYLISDGRDTHSNVRGPLGLVGTSPTGNDVYFKSADPLAGEAGAESAEAHIYDARVNGGFPAATAKGRCASECQGPGTAGPLALAPASTTLSDLGNVSPVSTTTTKVKRPVSKLARALKACKAKHNRHRRAACEAAAHRRYGHASRAVHLSRPRGKR